MEQELIIEIKQLLHNISGLKTCHFIIKNEESLTRKVVYLKNLNDSIESVGAIEGTGAQAYYYEEIKEQLEDDDASAASFLIESNLKLQDLKEIDDALNIIKELQLINLDFTYIRGQE